MNDTVEINIRVDEGLLKAFKKMTKEEVLNRFYVAALESQVARDEAEALKIKLHKAEADILQAKAMLRAAMSQWGEE